MWEFPPQTRVEETGSSLVIGVFEPDQSASVVARDVLNLARGSVSIRLGGLLQRDSHSTLVRALSPDGGDSIDVEFASQGTNATIASVSVSRTSVDGGVSERLAEVVGGADVYSHPSVRFRGLGGALLVELAHDYADRYNDHNDDSFEVVAEVRDDNPLPESGWAIQLEARRSPSSDNQEAVFRRFATACDE